MGNDILKRFEKKFGDSIFVTDDSGEDVEVISTGSLSMDVSIGVGGIPKGKITTIYGAESSGKTTLCLEISKNCISNGGKVLYIDAEQGLDYNYVKAVINNFTWDDLFIAQPESAEDALQIAEAAIQGDDKAGIDPGQFSLIILDSVGALSPQKEKDKELTDSNVALVPRLLSAFLRRNAYEIRKHNIAFVFVNQVRDNIGSYVGGYTLPGGHALKHYSSLIIFMSKSGELKVKDESIGITSKFVIKKNKLAPPFRSYAIPVIFGKGIDYYRDVVDFTEMLGILKRRGAFYILDNVNIGQGIVKAAEYLMENKESLDRIVKMCYDSISMYKELEEPSMEDELVE